jgi:hypothetical protein
MPTIILKSDTRNTVTSRTAMRVIISDIIKSDKSSALASPRKKAKYKFVGSIHKNKRIKIVKL